MTQSVAQSGTAKQPATDSAPQGARAAESREPQAVHVGLAGPTLTLWRREMVRFFRQRNRVMSALVTPVLFWLMLGSGLDKAFSHQVATAAGEGAAATGGGGDGVGYMTYFFPGTITMILLFTAIFSTITVIEDRREGFLQGVLVSPVPRLAIVLGKVLGGASIAMIHALLFLAIWPFVGDFPGVGLFVAAIAMMIVVAVALTALGVCIAWPMNSTAGFHAVMMLFLMPMWFLSGAIFPVSTAPAALRIVMLVNPLTYGHELIALSLTAGRASTGLPLHPAATAAIFLAVTALLLAIAVRMVNRPRKDGVA